MDVREHLTGDMMTSATHVIQRERLPNSLATEFTLGVINNIQFSFMFDLNYIFWFETCFTFWLFHANQRGNLSGLYTYTARSQNDTWETDIG